MSSGQTPTRPPSTAGHAEPPRQWWEQIPLVPILQGLGLLASLAMIGFFITQCVNSRIDDVREHSENIRTELTKTVDDKISEVDQDIEDIGKEVAGNTRSLDKIGVQIEAIQKDVTKIDQKIDKALEHAKTQWPYPSASIDSPHDVEP